MILQPKPRGGVLPEPEPLNHLNHLNQVHHQVHSPPQVTTTMYGLWTKHKQVERATQAPQDALAMSPDDVTRWAWL